MVELPRYFSLTFFWPVYSLSVFTHSDDTLNSDGRHDPATPPSESQATATSLPFFPTSSSPSAAAANPSVPQDFSKLAQHMMAIQQRTAHSQPQWKGGKVKKEMQWKEGKNGKDPKISGTD